MAMAVVRRHALVRCCASRAAALMAPGSRLVFPVAPVALSRQTTLRLYGSESNEAAGGDDVASSAAPAQSLEEGGKRATKTEKKYLSKPRSLKEGNRDPNDPESVLELDIRVENNRAFRAKLDSQAEGSGVARLLYAARESINPRESKNPRRRPHRLYGRVEQVRTHGSKLLFLDVVERYERLQVMVDYSRMEARLNENLAKAKAKWTRRSVADAEQKDGPNAETAADQTDDLEAKTAAHQQRVLQIEVRLAGLKKKFDLFVEKLARGSHVEIYGEMTRTTSGELTLAANTVPLIVSRAPEAPRPEMLKDDETRIRQRHLDLTANKEAMNTLRLRSQVVWALRHKLASHDFLEVQTPVLADHAGGAAARPFLTSSAHLPGRQLALRVAPELWLKRLVMGGMDRIFEIGPCFRNEGIDLTHNPEFTMLESYEAYAHIDYLIRRTSELLSFVVRSIDSQNKKFPWLRNPVTLADGVLERFTQLPYKRIQFIPTLEDKLGFKLPFLYLSSSLDELKALLDKHGHDVGPTQDLTMPQLLDRLQTVFLEPESEKGGPPVFITHHPAAMSPLAFSLPNHDKQPVSSRAELFVDGIELANMYQECNSPNAQVLKFRHQKLFQHRAAVEAANADATMSSEAEALAKEKADDEYVEYEKLRMTDVEASYVEAMRAGMPPTGGIGIGIDRLVMVLSGAKRIRDVLSFGTLRNVVAVTQNAPPEAEQRKRFLDWVASKPPGSATADIEKWYLAQQQRAAAAADVSSQEGEQKPPAEQEKEKAEVEVEEVEKEEQETRVDEEEEQSRQQQSEEAVEAETAGEEASGEGETDRKPKEGEA